MIHLGVQLIILSLSSRDSSRPIEPSIACAKKKGSVCDHYVRTVLAHLFCDLRHLLANAHVLGQEIQRVVDSDCA